MTIRIRPYEAEDNAFIIAQVTRFSEFPLPEWRQGKAIDNKNLNNLQQAIDQLDPDSDIFIAEEENSGPVGFIHLQTETDYFSGEKQGYISDLAVVKTVEGKGVGRLLMEYAESWVREKGYCLLTLYVFAGNSRARQIYEKYGFNEDLVKYAMVIKPLEEINPGSSFESMDSIVLQGF